MPTNISQTIFKPVSLWRRTFAYAIDLIIVALVIFLPMQNLIGGNTISKFEVVNSGFDFNIFFIGLLVSIMSILYWAILEYKINQSVGKVVMDIKVINKTQGKLKFGQCFLRNVTKLSLIFLILDTLYGFIKKDYRRFFEVISNTMVVSTNGNV